MVTKDIPPYVIAGRYPVSYEGVNSVGLKRNGFTQEEVNTIQDTYRVIFIHNNNVSKGIAQVEDAIKPSQLRDEILEFIQTSERGVMKGFNKGK